MVKKEREMAHGDTMGDSTDSRTASAVAPSSHTPGPWSVRFGEQAGYDCMFWSYDVISANGLRTASLGGDAYGQPACDAKFRCSEAAANARLIAAAPDLLAALKALSHGDADCWCDFAIGNPMYPTHSTKCVAAKAAIAKAEGR